MEWDFFSRIDFSLVTVNSELCLLLPLLPRRSCPAGLCRAKGFLPGASLLEVHAGAGILLDQRRRQCLNLTIGDGVFSTCISVGVFVGLKLLKVFPFWHLSFSKLTQTPGRVQGFEGALRLHGFSPPL